MFTCSQSPDIPAEVTDQSIAVFIVKLYDAWWDCAYQLHRVGTIIHSTEN